MRYKIKKKLVPIGPEEEVGEGEALVEIMSRENFWKTYHARYQDHLLKKNLERAQYCKADLLKDCIIGTFVIPIKKDLLGKPVVFGYYMDRKQLIFVDDSGEAGKMLHEIERTQILEKTCVSHLLFEFLEYQVRDEVLFLQAYEEKLARLEDLVVSGKEGRMDIPAVILKARKELAKLSSYYGQLLNVSQTLTENYNGMLEEEDRNLFHLFSGRMERLVEHAKALLEYARQIREMHQTHLEIKQNHALSFLTIVTTIFMPLTLIAGWYGMNFKHMPELNWEYGYMVCVLISIVLIVGEVWYFRKNGWFKKN